eukprot:s6944_g1.t1
MQHATQGKLHAEIAYRSAQAQAAFNEARRKVFKSPGVPLVRKAFIFRASVLPKLLYGAGAWPPLNAREYRLWGFYRQLLCIPRGGDQRYSISGSALREAPCAEEKRSGSSLLTDQLRIQEQKEVMSRFRLGSLCSAFRRPPAHGGAEHRKWLNVLLDDRPQGRLPCPADVVPRWPEIQPQVLLIEGTLPSVSLAAPPSRICT